MHEVLYNENKKNIDNMVYRLLPFLKKNAIYFDDVRSEANYIFVKCANNYDSKKGDFEKYLRDSLYTGLFAFCKDNANLPTVVSKDSANTDFTSDLKHKPPKIKLRKNHRFLQLHQKRIYNISIDALPHHELLLKNKTNQENIIENLPDDAKEVAKIVINADEKILNLSKRKNTENRKITKEMLSTYLHRDYKWQQKRIYKAFTTIEETLKKELVVVFFLTALIKSFC